MRRNPVIKKILTIFLIVICAFRAHAEIDTTCATRAFADGLSATANTVSDTDHETVIREWIYKTFSDKSILNTVLACPEIANAADTETIKFLPIEYTFPGGRKITVNYETQPKILRQRIMLSNKRDLPTADPNPKVGGHGDDTVWTNTDPAWYAIMVVEHGALDKFVGPDKNNTIGLEYIRDNIDDLYPSGYNCTSKSALAEDWCAINQAVTQTVQLKETTGEKDTNDYYVAGDVNLQWISYLEIALDVVITVVTMGGGTVITGITKSVRASSALKGLSTSLRSLSQLDNVRDYIKTTTNIANLTDEISKLDKVADAAKIADKTKELDALKDAAKTLEQADDVKKYRDAANTFAELNKYRRGLRALRAAQRGNIIARLARASKAALSGNKLITKAAKLTRTGTRSSKIRDWLFHSTLQNVGALGKMEATGGLIYGGLRFIGQMYDWTETSTGDFTSNVEFAPLLLLSADDLQGQENVINHGMWLLWAGDSVSAADDDAAFLQAMDFAAKFHQDLTEIQDDTNSPCNVDIYVVRPILRNPGTDNVAIYYLVMNDEPWTTSKPNKK